MVRSHLIGIDVGGTFTDAVVLDGTDGRLLAAFKLPSTPDDPGRAVLEAVAKIAQTTDVRGALLCHGTTVGTNTLIQRKGARTALVATRGFADVIELRRQARPILYGFDVAISEPLVPPALRFEADERVDAEGRVVTPLDGVEALALELAAAEVDAVAVCLLHAYASDTHEARIVAALEAALPGVFITRSSDVCPEFKEYERSSTTVVNAYIGPSVSRYLQRLDAALEARGIERLMVVKSNGGLTAPKNAAAYPVHLIESGPAAGLIAAAAYARASGRGNLLALDMGGTTAKAGLIRDGEPSTSGEFYADRLVEGRDVGGYAIRSAVLDLVEIGAGGGSLAWIDEAGVLKVGPRSAGADPGPACYGRGGDRPTVTDAHAAIGTITAHTFAGSGVAFEREAAIAALRRHIADPLGWSIARAAYAIIDIAVASMAEMARLLTVQRGLDPRDFAVMATGGAGPLHAAAVGAEIGALDVIVPPFPGMFSALGATLGFVRHEVVRTFLRPLEALKPERLVEGFRDLLRRAETLLAAEPKGTSAPVFERYLEARFVGQLFELKIPLGSGDAGFPSAAQIDGLFRSAYKKEYGFDLPEAKIEIVNMRLVATLDIGSEGETLLRSTGVAPRQGEPLRRTSFLMRSGETIEIPVYRAADAPGATLSGPAIIEHFGSTAWIHAGQTAAIGANGHIQIRLGGAMP